MRNLSVRDSHLPQSPMEMSPENSGLMLGVGLLPSGPTPLWQEEAGRSPGVGSAPVPLRILGASFPSSQSGENVKIVATASSPGSVSGYLTVLTGSVAQFPEPRPGISSINHTESEFPSMPGSLARHTAAQGRRPQSGSRHRGETGDSRDPQALL